MHVFPMSISALEKDEFKVYPNPSDGQFIIKAESKGTASITNVLGQIVYSSALNKGENKIDLDIKLPDGEYILTIKSESEEQNMKLLISH
jgi:hypothetical protein